MAQRGVDGGDGGTDADRTRVAEVASLIRALVDAANRGGVTSVSTAGDAVEGAARALVRRVVVGAIEDPRPVPDQATLLRALSQRSGRPGLGGASAAAIGTRVARRVAGPARFAARRTPMWLAVTALPAVYASVTHGAEELALVASHLVHRSRAAGVEPDVDRLRRVAVQVVSGRPVRPDHEPSHGPLAGRWVGRAARATLPFAAGVATRDPGGMAAAAASVDPHQLSAPAPG